MNREVESSILARTHIMIAADPGEQGKLAAAMLLGHARAVLLEKPYFDLVISGGTGPIPFFGCLALEKNSLDWNRVRFFWADERDVPPTDPQSNFRLADQLLLKPLGIPLRNIFRLPVEQGAENAAAAYEKTLRELFGEKPLFDYVSLGLGEDGHTASLFPDAQEGWAEAQKSGQWVAAPWIPHLGAHRMTLLPIALNQGTKVRFIVSGEKKAEILRKVLLVDGQAGTGAPYPAQLIHSRLGKALWLVDVAAASRLHSAERAA